MISFNDTNINNIKLLLTKYGYSIQQYTLSQLRTHNVYNEPNTIILDGVHCDPYTAYVKLTNILKSRFTYAPPVLTLIAENSTDKQKLFQLGIFDYLSFPIIPEELIRRIKSTLYTIDSSATSCNANNDEKIIDSRAILAEQAIHYMHKELANNITLASLTRKLATNRNTLSKVFNDYVGMSIFTWLREQRLLKAADLLENTSMSVLSISEEIGYANANNFSSAFKKKFRVSPLKYRQQTHNPVHRSNRPNTTNQFEGI